MFPTYTNQSVGLKSKSTDWFLRDGNIGREKVNDSSRLLTFFAKMLHYRCLYASIILDSRRRFSVYKMSIQRQQRRRSRIQVIKMIKPKKFETLIVKVSQLRSAMEYDRSTNPVTM